MAARSSRRTTTSRGCTTPRTRNASSPIRSRRTSTWKASDALSPPHRGRPRRDAPEDRRRRDRRSVRRHSRPTSGFPASSTCPRPRARSRSSGILGRMAARNVAGRDRAVLRRRRRLSPPCAGERRPSDPALRVPHLLHALPARGVSQGTLQYLFEFQTQVANLTGMEVANASMYDGSTGDRRGGADGAPRDQATEGGALRRPPPAVPRRGRDRVAHGRGHGGGAAAGPDGHRGDPRRDRRRDLLRRRPVAVVLRQPDRPRADRREGACGRRAARRRVHRGGGARRDRAAGDARGRHRRRRGPVDRQSADLRRALCRAVRDAAEIRPPDAGPALRRDGRRRGPPRLRADALDPRAAHPPRQGDLEHLHQFGPLLPRLHHPHDAARRDRTPPARGAQPRQRGAASRNRLSEVPGVSVLNDSFFNEFTIRVPGNAAR